MESYRLDSRIVEDDKEFLIQTVNDTREGIIKTSLFANGELLDSSIMPHSEEMGEPEILELIKATHGEKKSELEYLLKSFKEVMVNYVRDYGKASIMPQGAIKAQDVYNTAMARVVAGKLELSAAMPDVVKKMNEALALGRKRVSR